MQRLVFYSVEGSCEGPVLGGRYPYIGALLALGACMYSSDSKGA